VNVLRQTHQALVPGGVVVDLHPIGIGAHLEAGGQQLGELDEADFRELVVATEAGLEETIRRGLFVREAVLRRELVERWDDAEELLEDVAEWETQRVPPDVERRVRTIVGPVDLIERFVFQRLRAT
jgi:hypothetical protein